MSINELNQRAGSTNPRRTERETNISPDGKWKSFPRVPHLLQYVPSGKFFGRVKANGKIVRQTLKTDVFTTAKLRLGDFLKAQHKRAARVVSGTFGEARAHYEREVDADHTLKEASKLYRHNCVKALLRTWPELDAKAPAKITEADCRAWASRFAAEYDGARQSKHCADLVRFLAFSGCRISEAGQVRWADVDSERAEIRVQSAKRAKTSGAAPVRFVPIIPPMRELLLRLKQANPSPEVNVCHVGECEKSLTRGCKLLKIHRITHHDLRHLFATRCIESGVDIPTVSRWLGHSDGGALAMRTYGHLRREHSATMAQRVTFSSVQPADLVTLKTGTEA